MISPTFKEFQSNAEAALAKARQATRGPLPLLAKPLLEDLSTTTVYYGQIQYILADAEYWYRTEREKANHGLAEGLKALDKDVALDAKAADARRLRDMLENYGKALRDRISLGQSVLSYIKEGSPPLPGGRPGG